MKNSRFSLVSSFKWNECIIFLITCSVSILLLLKRTRHKIELRCQIPYDSNTLPKCCRIKIKRQVALHEDRFKTEKCCYFM